MNLGGRRIALFESRLGDVLSELVRRSGGIPVCVPAVRERRSPAAEEIAALLSELGQEAAPIFVFATGVGAKALFEEAQALGRGAELREALSRSLLVCRGPKPAAVLHREGLVGLLRAEPPFTTQQLLETLARVELRDRLAVLVHYGERNPQVAEALSSRGARLRELLLYHWELPEDTAPLAQIIAELEAGAFEAAAFTTQIQARHLVQIAESLGRRAALVSALRSKVVVAAVGPTCARALEELGVRPQVVADPPKMGAMVSALAAHLAGERR